MKNFKYTSFGIEHHFDTLDELQIHIDKNSIDENLTLYQREKNTNNYVEIGEIKNWIR